MIRTTRSVAALLVLVMLLPLVASGQGRRRSGPPTVTVDYDSHFVFTRIRYGSGLGRGGGDAWAHDYPMADRNFAAILDYISNMRVRLDGTNVYDLDDAGIFREPDHLRVGAGLLDDPPERSREPRRSTS